jgi:hypothetical protein
MTNDTIQIKVKQRINKLASNDYDNIMPWQIVEAFNKAQVTWCRRNLMGTNMTKTGDEASKRRIDDLQVLLSDKPLQMVKKDLYYQSSVIPGDYFEWKRLSSKSKKDCCDKRQMVIYLAEEANVDELLRDHNKKPSFEWAETFATVLGNKIKVYTNNDFELESTVLTYYRQPRRIQIPGTSDPYTGLVSTVNVECEFKDDLVELFIDECVKILAGDLEDVTANQIADNSVETNN